MIVDTSALLSFFDRDEPSHQAVADVLTNSRDALGVSPFVLAELDYLVGTRLGVDAEVSVLREVGGGAWDLARFDVAETLQAAGVVDRYRDPRIGLADASNLVLARRYATRRIATLDRRHFEVLRPLQGGRFTVVP